METLVSEKAITPAKIMEVGLGFLGSKALLTAIKLELFTYLGDDFASAEEIRSKLNLDQRSLYDFLDAMVALGFLKRTGIKETATYSNSEETALFLDKNKPSYIGGVFEMANDRLYSFWNSLEEGLKTGKPQNEIKVSGKPLFEAIYADPQRLEMFLNGMAGFQYGNFKALASIFPFENYATVCDIGGANGLLSVLIAQQHPHLKIKTVDLPPVEPIAQQHISQFGLNNTITVESLDMMNEEFPKADVITMGNILHDWNLDEKKHLIAKAYDALPEDGVFIAIESIIDDERKENVAGLLMSLNMLIETEGGFDYTFADFEQWAREAGFKYATKIPLGGPVSAVVAYK